MMAPPAAGVATPIVGGGSAARGAQSPEANGAVVMTVKERTQVGIVGARPAGRDTTDFVRQLSAWRHMAGAR